MRNAVRDSVARGDLSTGGCDVNLTTDARPRRVLSVQRGWAQQLRTGMPLAAK